MLDLLDEMILVKSSNDFLLITISEKSRVLHLAAW